MEQQMADHWPSGLGLRSEDLNGHMTVDPAHLSIDFPSSEDDMLSGVHPNPSLRYLYHFDIPQADYPLTMHGEPNLGMHGQDVDMSAMPPFDFQQEGPSFTDPDFDIELQPEARPISQEQLVGEIQDIYAGLAMVEAKFTGNDTQHSEFASSSNAGQGSQGQAEYERRTPHSFQQQFGPKAYSPATFTSSYPQLTDQRYALANSSMPALRGSNSHSNQFFPMLPDLAVQGSNNRSIKPSELPVKGPKQIRSRRRREKTWYRRSVSRTSASPPQSSAPQESRLSNHGTSNSTATIDSQSSHQNDAQSEFETFNPTSPFAQRKKAYLIREMKALADKKADLDRQMRVLMVDDEKFGGYSDVESNSNLASTLSSSQISVSNSEVLESDESADSTSISSTPRQPDIPASMEEDMPQQKHETCIDCGFKTLYSCIYPGCDYAGHLFADWKRHGKTHWEQTRIMCPECTPDPNNPAHKVPTDENGHSICAFCKVPFESLTGSPKQHFLQCITAQNARHVTFGRKDHTLTHLRNKHHIKAKNKEEQRKLSKKLASWEFTVDSDWPRHCEFCAVEFETLDEKMKHLAEHFQRRLTTKDWRLPPPPKDFRPGPGFPFRKDEDDDNNDDGPHGGNGGSRSAPGHHGHQKNVTHPGSSTTKFSEANQGQRTQGRQRNSARQESSQKQHQEHQPSPVSVSFMAGRKHSLALERYLNDPHDPIVAHLNSGLDSTSNKADRTTDSTAEGSVFTLTDQRKRTLSESEPQYYRSSKKPMLNGRHERDNQLVRRRTSGPFLRHMNYSDVEPIVQLGRAATAMRLMKHSSDISYEWKHTVSQAVDYSESGISEPDDDRSKMIEMTHGTTTLPANRHSLPCYLQSCGMEFAPDNFEDWARHNLSHYETASASASVEMSGGAITHPRELLLGRSDEKTWSIDTTMIPLAAFFESAMMRLKLEYCIGCPPLVLPSSSVSGFQWGLKRYRQLGSEVSRCYRKTAEYTPSRLAPLSITLAEMRQCFEPAVSDVIKRIQQEFVSSYTPPWAVFLSLGMSKSLTEFLQASLNKKPHAKRVFDLYAEAQKLAGGLQYLHDALGHSHDLQNNSLGRHSDLKPANVLVAGRHSSVRPWRIVDFEVSEVLVGKPFLQDILKNVRTTSTVLISALPGGGKTHIAREYVYAHKGKTSEIFFRGQRVDKSKQVIELPDGDPEHASMISDKQEHSTATSLFELQEAGQNDVSTSQSGGDSEIAFHPSPCSLGNCRGVYVFKTLSSYRAHLKSVHAKSKYCQALVCGEKAHGWTDVRSKNTGKDREKATVSTGLHTPPTTDIFTPSCEMSPIACMNEGDLVADILNPEKSAEHDFPDHRQQVLPVLGDTFEGIAHDSQYDQRFDKFGRAISIASMSHHKNFDNEDFPLYPEPPNSSSAYGYMYPPPPELYTYTTYPALSMKAKSEPADTVIAFLGTTGAGKSTFISSIVDGRKPSPSLAAASQPSASSSAMGSPFGSGLFQAPEISNYGLGIKPSITAYDCYAYGFDYGLDKCMEFGKSANGAVHCSDDAKGYVDPSILHGAYSYPSYEASPSSVWSSGMPNIGSQSPYHPCSQAFPSFPYPSYSDSPSDDSSKGRCPHLDCGKVFKDLKAHLLTHQIERSEKCPVLSCEYHVKGFVRKYDKNRHTLTHYKGTMVCGFCPGSGSAAEKSFNRADVFKRHLTTVHSVEQTPPNSRKKTLDNAESGKTISNYAPDATGKCSTCSGTFSNAQDFYEHLDDCVLRIVNRETPSDHLRRRLSPRRRFEVAAVRKAGSCPQCRLRKVRCMHVLQRELENSNVESCPISGCSSTAFCSRLEMERHVLMQHGSGSLRFCQSTEARGHFGNLQDPHVRQRLQEPNPDTRHSMHRNHSATIDVDYLKYPREEDRTTFRDTSGLHITMSFADSRPYNSSIDNPPPDIVDDGYSQRLDKFGRAIANSTIATNGSISWREQRRLVIGVDYGSNSNVCYKVPKRRIPSPTTPTFAFKKYNDRDDKRSFDNEVRAYQTLQRGEHRGTPPAPMSRRRDQSILPMPPVITTRPRNLHRHAFTDITPPRKLTEAECKEKLTSYTAYSIRKAPSPLFEHLWSRSDSSNNEKSTSSFSSSAVSKATQGDEIFQDVRRFVVLKKGSYTVALPITTYASKGHRHGDINMKEHCIIYNNRKPEETPAPTTDKIQGSHSKSMNWAPFERSSSHNQHSSAFAAAGAWMEDSYYSFGLRPSPSSSSSNGAKRKHHFPSYHNHDPVNFDDQDVLETLQNGWETFLGSGTAGDRPRLGREEVEILEASFKKNPKPTIQTKRRFSEDMGIELSRINNWFQNRRAKRKQEKKFEALAASEGPSLHELHSPPNTISTESQAGSTSIFKPLTSLSPTFELVQIDDTQSIDEVTIIQSHPLDFIASQNLH